MYLLPADSGELNINLQKMKKGFIWPSVFVGHGEVCCVHVCIKSLLGWCRSSILMWCVFL